MIMHAKHRCSIINTCTSEDMNQVKVFVTDGQTDRRTGGRMSLNVPRFNERRGIKSYRDGQNDNQTNKQDKNNMSQIILFDGIKISQKNKLAASTSI